MPTDPPCGADHDTGGHSRRAAYAVMLRLRAAASPRRWGPGLLGLCLLLSAGCTAPEPEASPPSATPPGPSGDPASPSATATERGDLVVVGHAARPALELTTAQAARLIGGGQDRFRGSRVLRADGGTSPAEALRTVERDPGVVAVVPAAAVGPTVTVAQVAGRDPIRTDPRALRVTVVGDLMLTRGVPDAAAALRPMSARLRRADLTVGNLESTLSTDGVPTQGGDSFGGSPALLGPLRRAGFDAVSLANNHAGDFGPGALSDTVETLAASRIVPFGAGHDRAAAARPAYLTRGGITVAFVGFNAIGETQRATASRPGAASVRMPPRTGPLVESDLRAVERTVRRARQRADAVVVLPHWGTQYTHRPEPIQRTVARRLARAGADLVVGGHPHWVQGLDAVTTPRGAVPVVHSLGNAVFDMDFMPQTMQGVLLEATFWAGELKAIRLVPYLMDATSFAPRVVRGAVGREILGDVRRSSTGPYAP